MSPLFKIFSRYNNNNIHQDDDQEIIIGCSLRIHSDVQETEQLKFMNEKHNPLVMQMRKGDDPSVISHTKDRMHSLRGDCVIDKQFTSSVI